MTTEAEFHQERLVGVGASDVHHVLYELPWGCARRLAYEKLQIPADFPPDRKLVFARGKYLESAAAERYAEETGQMIVEEDLIRDPEKPWRRVHTDRRIFTSDGRDGVLEIKTANASEFARLKREGMRPGYILQLQYAMGITKRDTGAFAVLHPDSWRLLHWEVGRDEELIGHIFEEVDKFWLTLSADALPPQLPHTDDRCQRCPWRITCHGTLAPLLAPHEKSDLVEMESISEALADFREAQALSKATTETFELAKDRLKEALGAATAASCHGAKVYFRPQVQTRVSTQLLKSKYPAIAKECETTIEMQALRVYFPRETGE